jgi:hypothetical protein
VGGGGRSVEAGAMEIQKKMKNMNAGMQAAVVTDSQLSTAHISARYGNAGPAMLCTTALCIPMPAGILVERKRTFLDIPI